MTRPSHAIPPRHGSGGSRRAFALPLVILLSLVAVLIVAAMLDRQGAQRSTVSRAADDYRSTHFSRGVIEVMDTWMSYQGTKPVRDLLAADGKAMDMELADGSTLSVFLRDAQGPLLSDLNGLPAEDAADLRGALEHLTEAVAPEELHRHTRRFGPGAVSTGAASVEVLTAIAQQIGGAEKGVALLDALLELHEKSRPTAQDLNQVAVSCDLDDAQRKRLSRLVTVDCGFYRLTMDARGPGASPDSPPISRYGAYALPRQVGGTRARNVTPGSVQRRCQIVGWERLDGR